MLYAKLNKYFLFVNLNEQNEQIDNKKNPIFLQQIFKNKPLAELTKCVLNSADLPSAYKVYL